MPQLTEESPAEQGAGSEIDQISALFNQEPEKASAGAPEKEQAPDEESPAGEPEKDDDGEVDASEQDAVDYGMKVPITGGEPVTLGELKDLWQNQQSAKLDLIERETQVMREIEKANLLLSYVKDLPPGVAEAASRQATVDYQHEMNALLNFIPEARTPTGAQAMKDAIYGIAAEYGIDRSAVDQIKNAVTIKMLYDYARLKQGIRSAKENVKPLKPASAKAAKQSIQPPKRQYASETEAIDALLRSA